MAGNENINTETKADSELTMDEAFARLDAIIKRMQEDDVPLEESFELYKRGLALTQLCSEKIDKVEKEISRVTEEITGKE